MDGWSGVLDRFVVWRDAEDMGVGGVDFLPLGGLGILALLGFCALMYDLWGRLSYRRELRREGRQIK